LKLTFGGGGQLLKRLVFGFVFVPKSRTSDVGGGESGTMGAAAI